MTVPRSTGSVDVADVAVVGAGPAGWLLAAACAARGLDTVVVAPRPLEVWRPTYGLWADQCAALPDGTSVTPAATVWAGERRLSRGYAVLDNASLLAAVRRSGARAVAGRVASMGVDGGRAVLDLRDGTRIGCGAVVDASGWRRVLSGGPPPGNRAEQTAYGLVLPAALAAPLVEPGDAVFMRWGRTPGWPSFLYAVPLPGGRTLLEETSLARRPGLPVPDLAARLTGRLAAAGVAAGDAVDVERVRFAVDVPPARPRPGVAAFGVAAGMMHPATGYSVGDALVAAPAVADALADALPLGADAAARAAHAAVWTPAARRVRRLRDWGLRALLGLPPARVPQFFDAFFSVAEGRQRAYLSGRDDVGGTAGAMTAVFLAASWPVRAAMAVGSLRR